MRSLLMSILPGWLDRTNGNFLRFLRGASPSERMTSTPLITMAFTVVPSEAALLFSRRYFVSGMSTVVLTSSGYHIYG